MRRRDCATVYGKTEGGREELFCCYLIVFRVTTYLGRVVAYNLGKSIAASAGLRFREK